MNLTIVILAILFTMPLVRSENLLIVEDEVSEIVAKALQAFFYDQRIVSLILTEDEINRIPYQKYKTAFYKTLNFTIYDFTLSNLSTEFRLPGSRMGITPHSNIHSYIVSSEIIFEKHEILHKFFRQNPNAKWAIVVTKFIDDETILQFYRTHWDLYRMAYIFTMRSNISYEIFNSPIVNTSLLKLEKCHLFLFNPFELNDDGIRGTLTIRDTSNITTWDDWDNIFDFHRNLMNNLYQYPLKVVVSNDDLLLQTKSETEFTLPDGELITMLMKAMNFSLDRQFFIDGHIGEVLDNGTATGVTGSIEYNEYDFVANSRLMTDIGTNNTIFLYPHLLAHNVFLVKKQEPRDKHLTVMPWQNYSYPMNCLHVFIFILSVLFLSITEIFFQWKHLQMHQILVIVAESATLMFSFLEEHSISLTKWTRIYQRLFLCGIIMYSMLLTGVFKGTIVKELNNPLISKDAKYAIEIINSDKGVMYFISTHSIYRKFVNDNDLMMTKLSKRRIDCTDWEQCLWNIIRKDIVMLVRDNYAYVASTDFWDNKTGDDLYHVVPEPAITFFSAMTATKGSPYQKKLNKLILLCTEAGVIQYGIISAQHSLKLKYLKRYLVGNFIPKPLDRPININNIDVVLLVFLIMLSISTVVFLGEVLIGRNKKQ